MENIYAGGMPAYPQGEPAFVGMLKQHTPFTAHWEDRPCGENELNARNGLFLKSDFPDPEKLLETAYSDFNRFLNEAELTGKAVAAEVKEVAGLAWEEYRLTVGKETITLEASDTEAVRRGLYYLRDLLAGSPYLKLGTICRKPWLRNRISRCFFGPIKRPPFNIDELMNDIDYYPEEYLSRLAHEGVNGLWLTITFREICDTSIRKAVPDAARRIAKLRTTVERCRRYGIKTWVFCIEPAFWSKAIGNPVPPGCEDLVGPGYSVEEAGMDINSFCVNSEMAKKYLYECTYSLFSAVPNLGGLISISHGERMTSCLSRISCFDDDGRIPCSKRCGKSIGDILAEVLGSLKKGMNDANPKAELISWLYMPYVEQLSGWITQMPSKLPPDIALAFNFESGVTKRQLGSVRAGGDYWLSAVGPSDRFSLMAEAAKGHCQFAAKLQVACSHECATVPYIPAPGLVYRKYKKMKELGVRHVLQCWYFGNYPGLMNEAAGKLAYEDFSRGEDAFLEELAKPEWGCDWTHAVDAWKYFADGYSNYPLDIQFQYYGPMHDGPVWPLYLKQAMQPLTRTWKPEKFPSGDAIGEAMKHFELNELAELTGIMSRQWRQGMTELWKAPQLTHELEFTLAQALDLQFRSGHNILRFYAMRNALLDTPSDAAQLLTSMKNIVKEEIENSLRLAELCEQDHRLGYHSEAEVYKYYPAKLKWRADQLKSLLAGDFAEAERMLAEGADIGDFLAWPGETAEAGKTYGGGGISWSFESSAENITFHFDFESAGNNAENAFLFFMDRKGARRPLDPICLNRKNYPQTASGWHADYTISRLLLHQESVFFFGVERVEYGPDNKNVFSNDNPGKYMHEGRLYLGYFGPDKLRRIRL